MLWKVVVGTLVVLVLGVGGTGAACKLALNCGRTGGPISVQDVALPDSKATAMPAGLAVQVVAKGFKLPTSFAFLPDGRLLVLERNGVVRLVSSDGVVSPTPVLDISDRVGLAFFRAAVSISVDPRFTENHSVYLIYALRPRAGGASGLGPTHVVVSRFVMRGDSIDAASEKVILGTANPASGSCSDLPVTADCIPSDHDHIGGDLWFAKDGTLFLSTGDGGGVDEKVERSALQAQSIDSLSGKILHVTRSGKGVAGNPFATADLSSNRSKVWATGLRNPFRFTGGVGDALLVGDVGALAYEELDAVRPGDNLGWPCYEGPSVDKLYRHTTVCRQLKAARASITAPVYSYRHDPGGSITAGVVLREGVYPRPLDAGYLFGDWIKSTISVAALDAATGKLSSRPVVVATDAGGPVQFRLGPDGTVFLLSLNNGQVDRIVRSVTTH